MAFSENEAFTGLTAIAYTDMSAKQFFAVSFNTGNSVSGQVGLANAAKSCDGIMLDNPKAGKAGKIATRGITKAAISASQALTAGVTLLEVDTGSTLKVLASGTAVAKAMETLASTAAVCIIGVELLPSNAAGV
jgi:hypothetical protein